MRTETIFIGIGGLLLGAAGGILGSRSYFKKKYEKIANDEIEDMRVYFDNCHSAVENEFYGGLDPKVENGDKNVMKEIAEEAEKDAEKMVLEARKKLQKNWEGTTNYASYYQLKGEEEHHLNIMATEKDSQDDQNEKTDEGGVEEDFLPGELENKEFMEETAAMDPPIQFISEEEYGDLPDFYDHQCLFYYVRSKVYSDEDMNLIEEADISRILGDCSDGEWLYMDEISENYILNSELHTVYEIQKMFAEFDF